MTDTITPEELTNAAHYTQAINLLTHRTHQTTDTEAKNFLHQITPKFTTNKGRPIHINTKHWPHSTDLTLNTDPNNPHATRQLTYPLTGNIAENYIEDIIYKNCRVTTTSPITRGHTPTHKLIRYYNTHKKTPTPTHLLTQPPHRPPPPPNHPTPHQRNPHHRRTNHPPRSQRRSSNHRRHPQHHTPRNPRRLPSLQRHQTLTPNTKKPLATRAHTQTARGFTTPKN